MSESLYKSTRRFLLSPLKSKKVSASHLKRIEVLCALVSSCIDNKSCSLQSLATPDKVANTQVESRIKQAKRWLSSKWTDWDSFYAPYIRLILLNVAKCGEVILVVDGSEMAGFNVHHSKVQGEKRINSLIIILALAFILLFHAGDSLSKLTPKNIATFARPDRIADLTPINIAFKALKAAYHTLRSILSDMSKNIDHFFSASG